MTRYYLDHNATTPLDPRVRAAMEPYWEIRGNPSSLHAEGRRARAGIDEARDQLAALLGCKPSEIIFTAGGTESNNLAISGLAWAHESAGRQVITSASEHHAVLECCEHLQRRHGFRLTVLPVDREGLVDPTDLARALAIKTSLVSIMTANNETGVRQPVETLAQLCVEHGVLFHTDAVQTAGKERVNFSTTPFTAMSLTAHKFYGPLGAGVLCLKAGRSLEKLHHGGAQENSHRPGTENVAAIVGLAKAFALAQAEIDQEHARLFPLVEQLWQGLADLPGIQRNGHPRQRMANTLNVSFAGLDGEELLIGLDLAGLAVSSGSACLVGSVQPSHVLQAMGVSPEVAQATVRFSLGHETAAETLPDIIHRVRQVVLIQRSTKA
jgi:cysteine desulfurase